MNLAKNIALDQRKTTNALNTLMGLVNGIVCDGVLNDVEIQFLSTWMKMIKAIKISTLTTFS